MKALVVDDSSTIRDIVGTVLRKRLGLEVVEAEGTADALQRPGPFDLVVTDLVMPGEHGFELIRRLRERDDTRSVPILVVSVEIHPEVATRALEAGADRFLGKPFRLADLEAAVRELLGLPGGQGTDPQ
ncbi:MULTISPECIES: response regulator [Deferrisoma]